MKLVIETEGFRRLAHTDLNTQPGFSNGLGGGPLDRVSPDTDKNTKLRWKRRKRPIYPDIREENKNIML